MPSHGVTLLTHGLPSRGFVRTIHIRPGEWMINVSEFALQLSNQHHWLREQDADWHRPLRCNMKVFHQRNSKFPSAYNEKQVSRQSRYIGGQGFRGREVSRTGNPADSAEELPPWKLRQIWTEQTGSSAGWEDWKRRQDRGPWSSSRGWRDQPTQGSSGASSSSGWIDFSTRTEKDERRGRDGTWEWNSQSDLFK